jgi:hypothetical protein
MFLFEMDSTYHERDLKAKRVHEVQMIIITLDNHFWIKCKYLLT